MIKILKFTYKDNKPLNKFYFFIMAAMKSHKGKTEPYSDSISYVYKKLDLKYNDQM